MAEKIKNFFKKKKSDAKFKLAGPGHKLSESSCSSGSSFDRPMPKNQYVVKPRSDLSEEARRAAAAAEARINSKQQQDKNFNTSFAAIQAQVRRELEAEKKAANDKITNSPKLKREVISDTEISPVLAVSGVFFKCPMVGPDVLNKEEWRTKIKEFLYAQLEEERGLTAALMIYSLNRRDKVSICVETLCKYLENIINNPTEEKYQRIRMNNRIFCEKVFPIEGALDLLQGAGFVEENLTIDGKEDKYLVFSMDRIENLDTLRTLCDALRSAEPIPLELDRNLQVLSPSQAAKRTELPPTFYSMTPEEIKREQQLRVEAVEKSMQLRTKVMREKDELREMKKYKFALIRIRFPDGIFLQGTFAIFEKLVHIYEFVRDNLEYEDMPFILTNATGQKLNDDEEMEKTLLDLRLVPASILTFQWDPAVQDELSKSSPRYLKPEILMLVQSI